MHFGTAAFAREVISPRFDYVESLKLVMLMNGVGTVVCFVLNYFAGRTGPIDVFLPNALATSILLYV